MYCPFLLLIGAVDVGSAVRLREEVGVFGGDCNEILCLVETTSAPGGYFGLRNLA
jgi:hypothetical protein